MKSTRTLPPAIVLATLSLAAAAPAPSADELASLQADLRDGQKFARRAAVEKLGRIGDAAALATPDLVACLQSDPDPMVRLRSAWALGQIGEPVEDTVAALLGVAGDPHPGVRNNVAIALVSIGPAAAKVLGKALDSADPWTRGSAARALVQLGHANDERVLPVLKQLLCDPSPEVRQLSVNCCELAGGTASSLVPLMTGLLDDPSAELREVTVTSLAKVDARGDSIPSLIRVLAKDPSSRVRRTAAQSLGMLAGDRIEVVNALVGAFGDPDEKVGVAAAQAIAGAGAAAVPPLAGTLRTGEIETRKLAAEALVGIGPAARPALDDLLAVLRDDPCPAVRFRAAGAVGAIGVSSSEVIACLEDRVENDADPVVRMHAEGALRVLRPGVAATRVE